MRVPRALRLLQRIAATNEIDQDRLAQELVVSTDTLKTYLSGEREIPLARQMCVAKLAIESFPKLARDGYTLRSQVSAAIGVDRNMTLKA